MLNPKIFFTSMFAATIEFPSSLQQNWMQFIHFSPAKNNKQRLIATNGNLMAIVDLPLSIIDKAIKKQWIIPNCHDNHHFYSRKKDIINSLDSSRFPKFKQVIPQKIFSIDNSHKFFAYDTAKIACNILSSIFPGRIFIMEPIKTIEKNGYTIKIVYDSDPCNPRDNDNLGSIISIKNRRYTIGDIQLNSFDDINNLLKSDNSGGIYKLVYCYLHSGISLSLPPFSCTRDSGRIGYIAVSREKILNEYGGKKITKDIYDKVINIFDAELKEYSAFLNGEVYGYDITYNNVTLDSCWGFYDMNYCEEEAVSVVKNYLKIAFENRIKKLKILIRNKVSFDKREAILSA